MIKKIFTVSPTELLYRILKIVSKKVERIVFPIEQKRVQSFERKISKTDLEKFLAQKKFFLDNWDREEACSIYKELFPHLYQKTITTADRLLKNELHYMGKKFRLPPDTDWQTDLVTGYKYPRVFYRNIVRHTEDLERYGDVKHLWELNRHQFFIDLAKAYYLTGEERYVAKILEFIKSWAMHNPYKIGFNWESALEVAVRTMSWIWTFHFIKDSSLINDDILRLFAYQLYLHIQYLKGNLSFYSSPYNHLIGELSGLFFGSYLLPEFKGNKRLSEKIWREIQKQIFIQFHPEGMGIEQSTFYHYFTFGFFIQAFLLRMLNGDRVDPIALKKMEKIFEFGFLISRPDKLTPKIGDADDAKSIYFSEGISWEMGKVLSIGVVLFDRKDMKYLHPDISEEIFWFLGPEGIRKFEKMEKEPPTLLNYFLPKSGYLVQRSSWEHNANYCLIDCGEISDGVHKDEIVSVAHGHADLFSFELCMNGEPIIVDPGFGNYYHEWERYFRKSKAHNLLVIDGKSLANVAGRMKLNFAPNFKITNYFDNKIVNTLSGWHDGYNRFALKKENIIHHRTFIYVKPNIWIIWDFVSGSYSHEVEVYYHLSEKVKKLRTIDNGFRIESPKNKVDLFIVSSREINRVSGESGSTPEDGWIYESYGVKKKAPVIVVGNNDALPQHFLTLIAPFERKINISQKSNKHYTCDLHEKLKLNFNFNFTNLNEKSSEPILWITDESAKKYAWYVDKENVFRMSNII